MGNWFWGEKKVSWDYTNVHSPGHYTLWAWWEIWTQGKSLFPDFL